MSNVLIYSEFFIFVTPGGGLGLSVALQGSTSQTTLLAPPGTIAAGQPSHVVGVVDLSTSQLFLYVNGVQAATTTIPWTAGIVTGNGPLSVGLRNENFVPFTFTGV